MLEELSGNVQTHGRKKVIGPWPQSLVQSWLYACMALTIGDVWLRLNAWTRGGHLLTGPWFRVRSVSPVVSACAKRLFEPRGSINRLWLALDLSLAHFH
jgi:hypothetical protein